MELSGVWFWLAAQMQRADPPAPSVHPEIVKALADLISASGSVAEPDGWLTPERIQTYASAIVAVAWPLTAIIVVLIFRKPILNFLSTVPLFFVLVSACSGASLEAVTPATGLVPITAAELSDAITAGKEVNGRLIRGVDLQEALARYTTGSSSCDKTKLLNIVSSRVAGDVALGKMTAPPASGGEPPLGKFLSIPVIIANSTVDGLFEISNITLVCKLELDGSTFAEEVKFNRGHFLAEFRAAGAQFSEKFSAISTSWLGPASFDKAHFVGNAQFGDASGHNVRFNSASSFRESVFYRYAEFFSVEYGAAVDFAEALFQMDVSFLSSNWDSSVSMAPFRRAVFEANANFDLSEFGRLYFGYTIFRGRASFDGVKGKSLSFDGIDARDRFSIDRARLDELNIGGPLGTQFEGELLVQNATIQSLETFKAVFRKSISLDESEICSLSIIWSVFYDNITMRRVSLGDETCSSIFPTSIVGSRFFGALYIARDQWLSRGKWWNLLADDKPRFADLEQSEWEDFERAFDKAQDLPLRNDASFRAQRLNEQEQRGFERFGSWFSRFLWGYGLRPLRIAGWAIVLICLFAAAYWTQLGVVGKGASRIEKSVKRIVASFVFSYRTAFQLTYGYDNTRGALFRSVAVIESVIAKVVLAMFAYSLTQASPLLSDLAKKLLP